MLIAGCASIRNLPEKILLGDPFSEMYSELNTITDVERIGKEELIIRFPDTALFGVDKYSFQAEGKRSLENVTRILRRYPGFLFIVEGHTDNKGRESYNQWLSERRSRIVADFLVNEGLDPNSIQVVGYGESRPLATNATPEGRQRNRRVEIHVKPRQPSSK
jgi:outer membrane protein OmpA-like peptidoglycan-associated protein